MSDVVAQFPGGHARTSVDEGQLGGAITLAIIHDNGATANEGGCLDGVVDELTQLLMGGNIAAETLEHPGDVVYAQAVGRGVQVQLIEHVLGAECSGTGYGRHGDLLCFLRTFTVSGYRSGRGVGAYP